MHVPCLQFNQRRTKYYQNGSSWSEQGYQRVNVTWKDKQDTLQTDPNPKSVTKAVSTATRKLKADFTSECYLSLDKCVLPHRESTQKQCSLFEQGPFGLGLVIPTLVHSVPHPSTHTHAQCLLTEPLLSPSRIVSLTAEWPQNSSTHTQWGCKSALCFSSSFHEDSKHRIKKSKCY